MNKTWYKKTILSYIPTLYLTIVFIVFICIFIIGEVSMKEADRTNRYSLEYIAQTTETAMRSVERRVIEELQFGGELYEFFETGSSRDPRAINYEANKKLRQIASEYPIIDSIYMFRSRDSMVLTLNAFETLKEFKDKDFLISEWENWANRNMWSVVRPYSGNINIGLPETSVSVLSLSQRTQLPLGREGMVIVNVSVNGVINSWRDVINTNMNFLKVEDAAGHMIMSNLAEGEQQDILNQIQVPYLQWTFTSGIQSGISVSSLQLISRVWIAIGFLIILISFIYTVLITKRNYKPIERIIQQIQAVPMKNLVKNGPASDEFAFIQKAIERLYDENMLYENEVEESQQLRKKQVFLQLLEADEDMPKGWREFISRLGYPLQFDGALTAIIEIDHYEEFEKKYPTASDQSLIKFALSNVLQEYCTRAGGQSWSEWTRINRLAVIHIFDDNLDQAVWMSELESFRQWVGTQLGLSVTIGVGTTVNSWEGLRHSFAASARTLQYKLSNGRNRLLLSDRIELYKDKNTHQYYEKINKLVQDFRAGKADWSDQVRLHVRQLQEELLSNDEVRHLLQYFKSLFERLMEDLPYEVRSVWLDEALPLWNEAEKKESLEEIAPMLIALCLMCHQRYMDYINSSDNKQLVQQIRIYIEDNYSDPNLSLGLINEQFKVSAKYVSQLFKDQLGINFAEFVTNLRMEKAKQLLIETEDSINEIALKVGYEIPLSFGRTFKRNIGVTPSEYRRNMSVTAQAKQG
jgi:two-component system response regulator YesN